MPLHPATFLHTAAVALGLLTYVLVTRAGRQRRHPSAAIGWVLAMVAFPYLAIPLFLMLGTRKALRPLRAEPASQPPHEPSIAPLWATRLAAGLGLPPVRCNARIALLTEGGAALEGMLALIGEARTQVDLSTYVFANDPTGIRVAQALIAAARRGVRVRLLLDAIGSRRMARGLRAQLAIASVEIGWFMPLLHNPRRGRTNLRNHRKLAIADGRCVWSGGRNIADEYFVDRLDAMAWRDISFVVEGPLAADAQRVFERDWGLAGGSSIADDPPSIANLATGTPAQLIASGPDHADDTIYAFLLTAVHQAQASILAVTPYFVPDDALLQALVIACRRGVRLTLLVPQRSNHGLADWARERALRELVAAGATVLLLPWMLHAKLMVVDEAAALCGSVNLDGRSLFLNYELTTAFYGRAEIEAFIRWFEHQSKQAQPYASRPPSWARDIVEGVVRAVAFQL